MISILSERFRTQPTFGSKFVYSVDKSLQNFSDQITDWDDVAEEGDPRYLVRKAVELMEKVVDGVTMAIELPAVLRTATKPAGEPATKKAKTATATPKASTTKSSPAGKKKAALPADAEHVNTDMHPAWTVPAGGDYLGLFTDRSPGTRKWPKIVDPRLAKQGRPPVSAPLCVKFQMVGKCVQGCTLSHVTTNQMTVPEFNQADRIMKEVLAKKPAT